MSNRALKIAGKNTIVFLPGRVISSIIGFLSIILFTKILGAEKYGDYSLIFSTISIFVILSASWLENTIIRFYPYGKNDKIVDYNKTIFFSTIISISIFSVLYIIAIKIFNNFDQYANLNNAFYFGLLAFVSMSFFRIIIVFFIANQQPVIYSIYSILFAMGKVLLALLLLFFTKSINMIFLGIFIIGLFVFPSMIKKIKIITCVQKGKFIWKNFIEYFFFGYPFSIMMIFIWTMTFFNRYIIKFYYNSLEVGIYSALSNISSQSLNFLFSGLMFAVYPVLVKSWETDCEEATSQLMTRFIRIYLIVCMPALVGLMFLYSPIIKLFTTSEFLYNHGIMPYLAITSFFIGLNQYFSKPMELNKQTKLLLSIMFGSSVVNILLALTFIPKHGLLGAAISTFISFFILTFINYFIGQKFLSYKFPVKSAFKILLSASCMGLLITLIQRSIDLNIVFLIVLMLISIILYLFLLILLREVKKNEINFIKSLIIKRC
jgi:O-antigen/teichoic acid export membrane protein